MNEFYVYELIDPRTNSVFYIGKGKGKRVFQHLNEKQKFNAVNILAILNECTVLTASGTLILTRETPVPVPELIPEFDPRSFTL